MSMLNTSISVGKINEKETNTSACYTGIIFGQNELIGHCQDRS